MIQKGTWHLTCVLSRGDSKLWKSFFPTGVPQGGREIGLPNRTIFEGFKQVVPAFHDPAFCLKFKTFKNKA